MKPQNPKDVFVLILKSSACRQEIKAAASVRKRNSAVPAEGSLKKRTGARRDSLNQFPNVILAQLHDNKWFKSRAFVLDFGDFVIYEIQSRLYSSFFFIFYNKLIFNLSGVVKKTT